MQQSIYPNFAIPSQKVEKPLLTPRVSPAKLASTFNRRSFFVSLNYFGDSTTQARAVHPLGLQVQFILIKS